jgi:4a-hydroxytetrahydrobiopterin dehydratase
MPISVERCVRPRFGDKPLTPEEIADLMPVVPGWDVVEDIRSTRLCKSFPFEDWSGVMEFAELVGDQAVLDDHHPKLTLAWGRVTVEWWTHVIGGLHRNDFIMACRTNHLYADVQRIP